MPLVGFNHLRYSIVIPVFNAQETLPKLHSELSTHMERLEKPFEIIFVDDCSLDNSWSIISDLAAEDSHVRGLQLMRNSGQGAATMAGLGESRGELVVTMDDDLQNPPYEVPRLCKFMDEHPEIDVLFGRPREKHHSVWRRLGSTLINRISNLMFEQDPAFRFTSFRVIRRELVLPLLRLRVPDPAVGALLTTLTSRLANVEVDHALRLAGRSGYSAGKFFRVILSRFLGFSTFPLRLLASIGLMGIAGSSIFGIYVVYRYALGNISVPGFTTLALLLIGLSGFMFLGFGIIGEYLQQILNNTRRNPAFVVRATHRSPELAGIEPSDPRIAQTSPQHSDVR